MEGFSKIAYKGKEILYADYSQFGFDKEKTLQLINGLAEEYAKCPPKSALALINVANLHFDTDIINALKENQEKSISYQKKVAVIGMKGLQKVAYNFIVSLTQRDLVKVLDNETEAKEWLVSD